MMLLNHFLVSILGTYLCTRLTRWNFIETVCVVLFLSFFIDYRFVKKKEFEFFKSYKIVFCTVTIFIFRTFIGLLVS